MAKRYNQVYQFRIELRDIEPKIWRVIQVPETYTFWDFHVAIQDAMGWLDCHLHEFTVTDPITRKKVIIGTPTEEEEGFFIVETIPGWKVMIADGFSKRNKKAYYCYDFGDDWQHIIKLEKILPKDKEQTYPRCIAGERACPPEDCGSTPGYEEIVDMLKNPEPDNEEYQEMMKWLGGSYDPEYFDCSEIFFDDPEERLKTFFEFH
jgi:hypothetical protein